jgi:single-stranded DNA-binding protein
MNRFTGVGTLPRAAMLNGGEKKVLKFTLCTFLGYDRKTEKERLAYVPCVVFKPSEVVVKLLAERFEGMVIGLEGRVSTSKFETKDGQTKYSTEIIVDQGSIHPLALRPIAGKSEERKAA